MAGVAACSHGSDRNGGDRPVITVSIEPQRWLLEQIVGDKMQVSTLLERGGNPESYEPAFGHLAQLERSACYMQMGNLGFETAVCNKIRTNNPDLPIVNTSDSLELIVDSHHGHDHGVDPHVWSSAVNARIIAANMLRAVCRLDSANSEFYRANYERLIEVVDSVDAACDSILAPVRGAAFLVWHPSLSYFARDYGLIQLSAGAEGKEHSVAETRTLIDGIGAAGARVFMVQKDFDDSRADVIAAEGDSIPVVIINPLNYDWDDELLHTARAIARKR